MDADCKKAKKFVEEHKQTEKKIEDFQKECEIAIVRLQPVARDLRDIITLYRIAHDLGRIANLTLSVTKKTQKLVEKFKIKRGNHLLNRVDLIHQVRHVAFMLRFCRQLAEGNEQQDLIAKIKAHNNEVGKLKSRLKEEIDNVAVANPSAAGLMFYLFAICRHYDRMADLCCTVSEEIVSLRS